MSDDLIQLVGELLPNVDPVLLSKIAKDFSRPDFAPDRLYGPLEDPDFFQGDVFSTFQFFMAGENGKALGAAMPSLLLSNTCGATRDEHIVMAVCYPSKMFESASNYQDMRNNKVLDFMHLPLVPGIGDTMVALAQVQTGRRVSFDSAVKTGSVTRVCRLSLIGYYVFLMKLSLHLMRREPGDVVRRGEQNF